MPLPSQPAQAAQAAPSVAHRAHDPREFDIGAQTSLPLQGITILAVEDSRFACEALRLMSMRSGARLRRASSLREARAHLHVYRPDVVIIDLGLPDGSGANLIAELANAQRRPAVVFGTSGDPAGRAVALASGALDFLDKPMESIAMFSSTLQRALAQSVSPPLPEVAIIPDPLALHDDLVRAAQSLDTDPDARSYVTAFLKGIARHARDSDLLQAAQAAADSAADLQPLRNLVQCRLLAPTAAVFTKR